MDLPVLRLGSAVALVFGGVGLLLGVFLLWRHLGTALLTYRILGTDPVPIGDLSRGNGQTPGLVQVRGTTAIADGRTVRPPFSATDCLAYEYERLERQEGRFSHWEPVAGDEDSVPFLVEDDTGAVQVDPTGCEFQLDADSVERVGVAEAPEAGEDTGTPDGSDAGQEHVERRLDVGQSVRVYGTVTPPPTDEWGRSRVVARLTGDGTPLVVTDRSSYATAWHIGKRPVVWTAIGAVAFFYGLSLLLYGLWLMI